jgi:hypothetical protein
VHAAPNQRLKAGHSKLALCTQVVKQFFTDPQFVELSASERDAPNSFYTSPEAERLQHETCELLPAKHCCAAAAASKALLCSSSSSRPRTAVQLLPPALVLGMLQCNWHASDCRLLNKSRRQLLRTWLELVPTIQEQGALLGRGVHQVRCSMPCVGPE